MRDLRFLFAFAGCLALATSADAATISVPLIVEAVVVSNCVIATSNVAFARYDTVAENAAQPLDASAGVTMLCTRNARATIHIDNSHEPIGSSRAPAGSSQYISYHWFRDPGRTQECDGCGTDGLVFVSEGIHKPLQLTVYGRVPSPRAG